MKPLPHPHLRPSGSASNLAAAAAAASSLPIPVLRSRPSPEYDFADEENLPSPFLKRVDKAAAAKAAAVAAVSSSSSNGPHGYVNSEGTFCASNDVAEPVECIIRARREEWRDHIRNRRQIRFP